MSKKTDSEKDINYESDNPPPKQIEIEDLMKKYHISQLDFLRYGDYFADAQNLDEAEDLMSTIQKKKLLKQYGMIPEELENRLPFSTNKRSTSSKKKKKATKPEFPEEFVPSKSEFAKTVRRMKDLVTDAYRPTYPQKTSKFDQLKQRNQKIRREELKSKKQQSQQPKSQPQQSKSQSQPQQSSKSQPQQSSKSKSQRQVQPTKRNSTQQRQRQTLHNETDSEEENLSSDENVQLHQFRRYDAVSTTREEDRKARRSWEKRMEDLYMRSQMEQEKNFDRSKVYSWDKNYEKLMHHVDQESSSSTTVDLKSEVDHSIFKQGMWLDIDSGQVSYHTPSSIQPENYHALLISTNSEWFDNRVHYYPVTSLALFDGRADQPLDYKMTRKQIFQAHKWIKRGWEQKYKEKFVRNAQGLLPKSLDPHKFQTKLFDEKDAEKLARKEDPLNPIYGGNVEQELLHQLQDVHNFEHELGYSGSFRDHWATDSELDRQIREKKPEELTAKEKRYLERHQRADPELLQHHFDNVARLPQHIQKKFGLDKKNPEKFKQEPLEDDPWAHSDSNKSTTLSQLQIRPAPPTPPNKEHDTFRTTWEEQTRSYERQKILLRNRDYEWDQSLSSMVYRHSEWDWNGTSSDYLGHDPQDLYLQGILPDKFIRAAQRLNVDEELVRYDQERSMEGSSQDHTMPFYFYQAIGDEVSYPTRDTIMAKVNPLAQDASSIFHYWDNSQDIRKSVSFDDLKQGAMEAKISEFSSAVDTNPFNEKGYRALVRDDPAQLKEFENEFNRKQTWKIEARNKAREKKHLEREERREKGEEGVSTTTHSSQLTPIDLVERRETQSTTSFLNAMDSDPEFKFDNSQPYPAHSWEYGFPQDVADHLPEDRMHRPEHRNRWGHAWAQAMMEPPEHIEYPLYAFPENRYNVFPINHRIGKLEYEVEFLRKKYEKTFWHDQNLYKLDLDSDDATSAIDLYQDWESIPVATVLREDFWELRKKQAIVKPRGILDVLYIVYDFCWQRKYHPSLKLPLIFLTDWAQGFRQIPGMLQPIVGTAPFVIWGVLNLSKFWTRAGNLTGSIALIDQVLPFPSVAINPFDSLYNSAEDGLGWWQSHDEFDDDHFADNALDFRETEDVPWETDASRWGGFPMQSWNPYSPFLTKDELEFVSERYTRQAFGGFDTDALQEHRHYYVSDVTRFEPEYLFGGSSPIPDYTRYELDSEV